MKNNPVKKILHEPVVIFLAAGLVFYLLQALVSNRLPSETKQIEVSADQLEQLASQFAATWLRAPTEKEFRGLIDSYIRNEVYYREALILGLDKNDQVIQNRLRQKLELLMDNMASVNVPSEQMLSTFLLENEEKFRRDYRVSFIQVYVNPENHDKQDEVAEELLRKLQEGANPENLGDRTLMGYTFPEHSQTDVARRFGNEFATQLIQVKPGEWTGPLYSGMGVHLVRITDYTEGTMPELSEIRSNVEREWMARQKTEMKDAAYKKLLEGYEVLIHEKGIFE